MVKLIAYPQISGSSDTRCSCLRRSLPVPFVRGDVFDLAFLTATTPFTKPPDTAVPDIRTLTSLNPLRGHTSAVFCGAFFHLFPEDKQEYIARSLAGLLSEKPGSMIFGVHGGRAEKGFWHPTGSEQYMFYHSPESWKILWESIFREDNVAVRCQLRREIGGDDFGTYLGNKDPYHVLEWSVTRL